MSELTISELAGQVGLNPSALRYYESIGLLKPTRRVGGQRRYDHQALLQLRFIQQTQKMGFTLQEIQILFEQNWPAASWEDLTRRKLQELDNLLLEISQMKEFLQDSLSCHCLSLEDCRLVNDLN